MLSKIKCWTIFMIIIFIIANCPNFTKTASASNEKEDPNEVYIARGIIPPGDFLLLKHNMGLDDLTFTSQFVKNDTTYDYSEYKSQFYHLMEIKQPTVFKNNSIRDVSTTALLNGNFVIAFRDNDNSGDGTFVIYREATITFEKVNNNEVRLWNNTDESLDLILKVNL